LTQFIATFPESSSPLGPHPVPLGTDSSRFAASGGAFFVNSHGTKIDLPGEFNLFRRSDLKSREKADYSEQSCVPATSDLGRLRKAAANCRACDLYREATQTVFGEGGPSVDIVFIGEQPGDQEDKVGRPFVGLAGHILDEALRAVGIDRSKCYVTNAVKHFKWKARGKRRILRPNELETTTDLKSVLVEPKFATVGGTIHSDHIELYSAEKPPIHEGQSIMVRSLDPHGE
jgi:hypothetical protein